MSYSDFCFFHPYTQLFMKEMCQWGHHPETCQRHSPAPQGAWTLHLAPVCAYFIVCILDHPEEESASSQCLCMAGSQASLGHSSRQLSGTEIFFFFFSVWLQIPYSLSDCQPFLHKRCFWKEIPQTCLFWAPPLQLWSTHSVAKSQRAVYFQFPFSVEACWGFAVITDLNWSFFTPATNLRSIRKAHISQNCSVTRQGSKHSLCQGESSSECLVYGGGT